MIIYYLSKFCFFFLSIRVVTKSIIVPVLKSLWGGIKIIYYSSKLHSFFSSIRVVTKYTKFDRIVDHTEHYIQFYTLPAICSDTRAVELGINRFV